MDDICQGTNIIPKGFKFIKLGMVIEFRQEWKEQDEMEVTLARQVDSKDEEKIR